MLYLAAARSSSGSSAAPSRYGSEHLREGLALQLFGGCRNWQTGPLPPAGSTANAGVKDESSPSGSESPDAWSKSFVRDRVTRRPQVAGGRQVRFVKLLRSGSLQIAGRCEV